MAQSLSVAPVSSSFVEFVKSAAADFKAYRAKRAVYNETVRELSSLSNRELADLGVNRSNINSIAYSHVYCA